MAECEPNPDCNVRSAECNPARVCPSGQPVCLNGQGSILLASLHASRKTPQSQVRKVQAPPIDSDELVTPHTRVGIFAQQRQAGDLATIPIEVSPLGVQFWHDRVQSSRSRVIKAATGWCAERCEHIWQK